MAPNSPGNPLPVFAIPELYTPLAKAMTRLFDTVLVVDLQTADSMLLVTHGELPKTYRFTPCGPCAPYADVRRVLLMRLHPDDREPMARARHIDVLREAFAEGRDVEMCHYRLLLNDRYVMMESRGFFFTDAEHQMVVLVARRLPEQLLATTFSREAAWFIQALRGTYTEMCEMNLTTDEVRLIFSNSDGVIPVGIENLVVTTDIISRVVHPDDRERLADMLLGESLRARLEGGCDDVDIEYRRMGLDGTYHWVCLTVVPRCEDNRLHDICTLLVRNIDARKAAEHQQRLSDQYTLVLRNIYDQLVECNLTRDSYRLTHNTVGKYPTTARQGSISGAVKRLVRSVIHEEDGERFREYFDAAAIRAYFDEGHDYRYVEVRSRRLGGGFVWQSYTMFPLPAAYENEWVVLVFVMDIEDRKGAEELARKNELLEQQRVADERYRLVIEQTHTLVFEWCLATQTRFLSPEIAQRFAGTYDDRDILTVWQQDSVVHPADLPTFDRFREECVACTSREVTVRMRRRDGTFIWCRIVLTWLRNDDGHFVRCLGTLNDVNEATCALQDLHYRAEYDILTGIHNMQAFYSRTAQLIKKYPERQYVIVRMDIDRFKVINELYGFDEGDRLLRTIARWLGERMDQFSVCARFNADVFCLCLHEPLDVVEAFLRDLAERLGAYPLSSRVLASFGICRVDSHTTPISALCDRAQLALKTIKGNVVQTFALYDDTLRLRFLEEKDIENAMHEALASGQFYLALQPKIDIATGGIAGAEALVRWWRPEKGLLPPDRFIPLFERNGFIIPLDEYVWEETCKLLRVWLDAGHTPPPVSVNMSPMHMYDTRLCEKILTLTQKYNLPPSLLEIELTESMFLDNDDILCSAIRELQSHGFVFLLDDFGAGYSSLNMLKTLPVDVVKLDRGFLSEVAATERGKTVIRHTIALARDLCMRIIAEGVETAEQADFLHGAGCLLAQGYFYSPPVPPEAFARMAFGTSEAS